VSDDLEPQQHLSKPPESEPELPPVSDRRKVQRVYVHPALLTITLLITLLALIIVVYSFNLRWGKNEDLRRENADVRVQLERARGDIRLLCAEIDRQHTGETPAPCR
jgi:ABC-type Fe3+ transport system permease subunit